MRQSSGQLRWGLGFVLLGIFGAAFAIAGMFAALPAPAVGGTCGPGKGSESSIAALFNPGSIGAEAEPAATNATAHADWLAFVGECQASTDSRMLATLAILVLSLGVAVGGSVLVARGSRTSSASSSSAAVMQPSFSAFGPAS